MKKTITLALGFMFAATSMFAKDGATASKHVTIKNGDISVNYGQPAKNGRAIFGTAQQKTTVVPFAKEWRAGDNTGTEITFAKDCTFNTFPVKAGTYTLLIQPLNMEWMITLNSKLGQKGVFDYNKVKSYNVVTAAVAAKKNDKIVENFTITIKDDGLLIEWDQMSAFVKIKTVQ